MTEFGFVLLASIGTTMIIFWLIIGGEGED